jgi:hypothetical protein
MASRRTVVLVILLIVLSGMLAGLDFDRTLVAMPAWQLTGPEAWAAFSRHADLGIGLVLYPVEAGGALLLAIGTILSARRDALSRPVFYALGAALLAAIAGLIMTAFAAPVMLSIASESDPATLSKALASFHLRGDLRGAFQIVGFIAAVTSLGLMARSK